MTTRPFPARVRIVSAGGIDATQVLDADTGEDVSHLVSAVVWQHVAGQVPRAVVTLAAVAADLVAQVACPTCGRAPAQHPVQAP